MRRQYMPGFEQPSSREKQREAGTVWSRFRILIALRPLKAREVIQILALLKGGYTLECGMKTEKGIRPISKEERSRWCAISTGELRVFTWMGKCLQWEERDVRERLFPTDIEEKQLMRSKLLNSRYSLVMQMFRCLLKRNQSSGDF